MQDKIIELNNTKYIELKYHEKALESLKRDNRELKNKKDPKEEWSINMVDEAMCLGIGSIKLKDGIRFYSRISLAYLKQAINICEKVTSCKKRESVVLGIGQDFPLLVGDIKEEEKEFSGVIIAPRIDEE